MTYDRENDKIGFWKTNCSELWKRLNHPSSPPSVSPLVPDSVKANTEIPPSVAPDGSPRTVIPGRVSQGCILYRFLIDLSSFMLSYLTAFSVLAFEFLLSQLERKFQISLSLLCYVILLNCFFYSWFLNFLSSHLGNCSC